MKVSELTAAQLDYWVAKAEGVEHPRAMRKMAPGFVMVPYETEDDDGPITRYRAFEPSSAWIDGGPLIHAHRISFATIGTGPRDESGNEPIVAITYTGRHAMTAPTHLIAAMRAIVRDKFGDEVPDTENA